MEENSTVNRKLLKETEQKIAQADKMDEIVKFTILIKLNCLKNKLKKKRFIHPRKYYPLSKDRFTARVLHFDLVFKEQILTSNDLQKESYYGFAKVLI